MMQFSTAVVFLSALLSTVSGQTVVAKTPVAGGVAVPKPTAKDLAFVLHIFKARDDKAILISRGKLVDTVGANFTLVTDLADVPGGSPKFFLDGTGFGSTGGGALGNKTKVYKVPEGALTIDMEECANIEILLNFTSKATNVLKVFGVIGGGDYIVLPNTTKKVGDAMEGKATIDDLEASGLQKVFDKVPAGSACKVSWVNGNGKKQTLKLIIGKDLGRVNLIIGIAISVMTVMATVTLFYVVNTGK